MNDRYVVTGGSSGVGAALVERLTRQGLEIRVLDVRSPRPEAPFAHFIETDLSSRPSMDAALAALPDRIAGLANVAGITRVEDPVAEDPVKVLTVNFLGLRYLTESLMGRDHSEWTQAQTGRIADPADIAEVIDLLLTGECGWLNGVDVPVDGGYSAGIESGWTNFADSPLMQRIRKAHT